ncbi:MAG TPA: hypothetical protein VEK34_02045 [Methylocella sp.]|nr:hypothetical protein [Methylocella sp.]
MLHPLDLCERCKILARNTPDSKPTPFGFAAETSTGHTPTGKGETGGFIKTN